MSVSVAREPVEVIKNAWEEWRQAMEEGWVSDWVEKHLTNDVTLIDYIPTVLGADEPIEATGKEEICLYYNKVLQYGWGDNSSIMWRTESMRRSGMNTVRAEFRVEVTPAKRKVPDMQVWDFKLRGTLIEFIMSSPMDESRGRVEALSLNESLGSMDSAVYQDMYSLEGRPLWAPDTGDDPGTPAFTIPHLPGNGYPPFQSCIPPYSLSTPPFFTTDPAPTPLPTPPSSSTPSPPSITTVRPCSHNSWDNVRTKRGWAILRCRKCQGQWRIRPADIVRCPNFKGNELDCPHCPEGDACDLLHIHFTRVKREQVLKERRKAMGHLKPTA
eukprot:Sspe_Gene.74123::Locus_45575_Transcript_1_1_Confidence_1.000_Length_1274::g.74123::m.74123